MSLRAVLSYTVMAFVKQPPQAESGMPTHRLVVVGSGGVGKSSITIQFFQHQFVDWYDPTIEEQYIQHCEIDNEWCKLDVLDTAGQDEFAAMIDHHMRTGRGFLLVYSVTDTKSFEKAQQLYTKILRLKDRDSYPVVLVANKVDLVRQRVVSEEEGRQLADQLKISYIESSAKENENVDEAFYELVRSVRQFPYEDEGDQLSGSGKKSKGNKNGKRKLRHCVVS